jgi:short-subunit dehydrogenase involved in D-alanine esterification of teichoic acids
VPSQDQVIRNQKDRENTVKICGNTIFIPGATSGIGLALALAMHDKGNKVIVGGRRQQLLDQIAAEHPGIDAVHIDTADADSIQAAATDVLAKHPDLNVLITMAGVMKIEDWHTPDGFLASAEATINTNVLGTIRLIAAFIEHLQNRPQATIITVSSGLGFTPLKVTPSYNASKAAVHLLTETLRLQFAGSTVEFKELEPPAVRTDLVPGQRDSEWAMPLEEFVGEVVEILETEPDANEIQVENVKFLRYAEVRGEYAHAVAVLNSADPHSA